MTNQLGEDYVVDPVWRRSRNQIRWVTTDGTRSAVDQTIKNPTREGVILSIRFPLAAGLVLSR